jgi:ParB family transcriptional regulator, chromosome partitioning protein
MTTTTVPATTAEKRKALGRGLESLLPGGARPGVGVRPPVAPPAAVSGAAETAPAAPGEGGREGLRDLAVTLIDRNPYQTRQRLDEAALEELAASIRASGVVQPIVVRPISGGRFQLIAGQRRWEASQRAGKASVPAVVREVSDQQAMEMTIVENLQRRDLATMEQARAFERLGREFGMTQEQMAQRTGIDRTTVSNFIRLLKLPAEVQALIEEEKISFGHAKVLLSLPAPDLIIKTAHKVVANELSVRALEELIFSMEHPAEKVIREQPVDPNVREAQMELERWLGVRVQIRDRNGKGKILIEYKSLEDFDRVVEALSRRN